MTGTGLVVVYTLYADREEARGIAAAAVEARLAACANILSPTKSHYLWNDAMERQQEYPVLFKTTAEHAPALRVYIAENHSYEVPAILSWAADATSDYARWVDEMTGAA